MNAWRPLDSASVWLVAMYNLYSAEIYTNSAITESLLVSYVDLRSGSWSCQCKVTLVIRHLTLCDIMQIVSEEL